MKVDPITIMKVGAKNVLPEPSLGPYIPDRFPLNPVAINANTSYYTWTFVGRGKWRKLTIT